MNSKKEYHSEADNTNGLPDVVEKLQSQGSIGDFSVASLQISVHPPWHVSLHPPLQSPVQVLAQPDPQLVHCPEHPLLLQLEHLDVPSQVPLHVVLQDPLQVEHSAVPSQVPLHVVLQVPVHAEHFAVPLHVS